MRLVPTVSSAVLAAILPVLPITAAPAAAQQPIPTGCEVYAANPMIEAQLFFGRNIGSDVGVSERDWSGFLDDEVTPRFPNGLTVTEASGHWRDSETGRLIREPSKIVTLLADSDSATLRLIREIVDLYKERFHQQSVGLAIRPVCASF